MKFIKISYALKLFNVLTLLFLFMISSCTLDMTDYESERNDTVEEVVEFREAIIINQDNYKISIEALNGKFHKGYNEIRLKLSKNNLSIADGKVTFLPILTNEKGEHSSCPHLYHLNYNATENYYTGYVVFTEESNISNWKLYLNFSQDNKIYKIEQSIEVLKQPNMNLNMTSFTGKDGEQYIIALVAPQKPKVAENNLVAGIYKYNKVEKSETTFPDPTQFSYGEVSNFTLAIDPRMPEPSMGNHSSPNNKDLIQENDGLYHGVVNYTMTGNWTLNFILYNQNGLIIKGTKVSTDFTPGIEGQKSGLHINTLF